MLFEVRVKSDSRTSGVDASKVAATRGRSCMPSAGNATTEISPRSRLRMASAVLRTRLTPISSRSVSTKSWRASGVGASRPVLRVNSLKPQECSKAWISLLTAGWLTNSASAALVTDPPFMTALKASICRTFGLGIAGLIT